MLLGYLNGNTIDTQSGLHHGNHYHGQSITRVQRHHSKHVRVSRIRSHRAHTHYRKHRVHHKSTKHKTIAKKKGARKHKKTHIQWAFLLSIERIVLHIYLLYFFLFSLILPFMSMTI